MNHRPGEWERELVTLRAIIARHRPGAYFLARDGHRECHCGHVLTRAESYEGHLTDAIARWLSLDTGGVSGGGAS